MLLVFYWEIASYHGQGKLFQLEGTITDLIGKSFPLDPPLKSEISTMVLTNPTKRIPEVFPVVTLLRRVWRRCGVVSSSHLCGQHAIEMQRDRGGSAMNL